MEVVKKWISLVTYIASYGYFNTQMIFFVTTNFFVTPLLKRSECLWLGSFCETVPGVARIEGKRLRMMLCSNNQCAG